MLQIPLVEGLSSAVKTTINDQAYLLTTNWNARFGYYSMDISVNGIEVVVGILLVSGVDIADISTIPLKRVYRINKNEMNKDFGYTGLGNDGLVVIIEDSDLEG